jgi:hypothetical protein
MALSELIKNSTLSRLLMYYQADGELLSTLSYLQLLLGRLFEDKTLENFANFYLCYTWRSTRGLPPPLKLESHLLIFAVLVGFKTKKPQQSLKDILLVHGSIHDLAAYFCHLAKILEKKNYYWYKNKTQLLD